MSIDYHHQNIQIPVLKSNLYILFSIILLIIQEQQEIHTENIILCTLLKRYNAFTYHLHLLNNTPAQPILFQYLIQISFS
jgi:hypothetical protein